MSDRRPTAIISGATSGIGLATATQLFQRGYRVAFCGRNPDRLKTAQQQLLAIEQRPEDIGRFVADFEDTHSAQAFATDAIGFLGNVDVLINNAGVAPLSNFESIQADQFETLVNVNIRSNFYLTQAVWKNMIAGGGGTIVNLSSLSAVDPFPGFSLYGASKAWLDLITQSLSAEGEPHQIRICSIRPGAVETPLLRGLFPDFPANQCVSPQDVAQLALAIIEQPDQYPSGEFFPITRQPDVPN